MLDEARHDAELGVERLLGIAQGQRCQPGLCCFKADAGLEERCRNRDTQCKMARVALNWTAKDLAEKAKVGVATVNRFEGGQARPITATLEAMQRTLEAAGVRFTDEGGVIPSNSPEPRPACPAGKKPKA